MRKPAIRDLGLPRLVHSWDAFDAEVVRQKRLVESGDLRSWCGQTWAWQQVIVGEREEKRWGWYCRWHGTGRTWERRSDRETAWEWFTRQVAGEEETHD